MYKHKADAHYQRKVRNEGPDTRGGNSIEEFNREQNVRHEDILKKLKLDRAKEKA
jgi:hypothetical protein